MHDNRGEDHGRAVGISSGRSHPGIATKLLLFQLSIIIFWHETDIRARGLAMFYKRRVIQRNVDLAAWACDLWKDWSADHIPPEQESVSHEQDLPMWLCNAGQISVMESVVDVQFATNAPQSGMVVSSLSLGCLSKIGPYWCIGGHEITWWRMLLVKQRWPKPLLVLCINGWGKSAPLVSSIPQSD